ncbi:MAG: hypothetical protein JWS12_554 [Candidatus Saccharibacteria bacterium]|nr:hypothetical protein [Candidatus Saccharibacteria bacterium]
MTNQTLTFEFNTAITGINEETGTFNSEDHRDAVLPLRGRIMQHDGVFGCNINRFDMSVEYRDNVTNSAAVAEWVQVTIDWATQNLLDLFPLRGDKRVLATPQTEWPFRRVIITFNSNLARFTPMSHITKQIMDQQAFADATRQVAIELTDLDGVKGYVLELRAAALDIDTRVTDVDRAKQHLESVISKIAAGRLSTSYVGLFPYLRDQDDLTFGFIVQDAN